MTKIYKSKKDFSLHKTCDKKDDRQKQWAEQREKYNFDETELWNLDSTIIEFIIPRLKSFINLHNKQFNKRTNDAFKAIVDGLIIHKNNFGLSIDEEKEKKRLKALRLLGKYLPKMWI